MDEIKDADDFGDPEGAVENGKKVVLTSEQRADAKDLRDLEGLTRGQARYRVLTPGQREPFNEQSRSAERARRAVRS